MSWLNKRALGNKSAQAMERSSAADWPAACAAAKAGSLDCARRIASSSVITTSWATGAEAAVSGAGAWPRAMAAPLSKPARTPPSRKKLLCLLNGIIILVDQCPTSTIMNVPGFGLGLPVACRLEFGCGEVNPVRRRIKSHSTRAHWRGDRLVYDPLTAFH